MIDEIWARLSNAIAAMYPDTDAYTIFNRHLAEVH